MQLRHAAVTLCVRLSGTLAYHAVLHSCDFELCAGTLLQLLW
jgi:hypothetical protein